MTTNLLLRTQQNDIYREIQRLEMSPPDFAWREEESRYLRDRAVPVLVHSPTEFDFVFDTSNQDRWVAFSSPHLEQIGRGHVGKANDWQSMLEIAKSWLVIVAKEHFEPYLWRLNESEGTLSAPLFDALDNRKFTEVELARISSALSEIRAFLVATSGCTTEQLSFVDSRLTHLEEASKRLGRKDWITLAMGALTNIVVGIALAPEAARELLRTANSLLGWVASGALSLPY